MQRKSRAPWGAFVFYTTAFALGGYFTFAAVQGDYGLFRRVEAEAFNAALSRDLHRLQEDVVVTENLTRRLSDEFLDLDLLDEQARSVLGLLRADEIVIR